jgi:hypothetical protein
MRAAGRVVARTLKAMRAAVRVRNDDGGVGPGGGGVLQEAWRTVSAAAGVQLPRLRLYQRER